MCCGVLQCVAVTLGSKNRIWACAHCPKNTALNPAQAKSYKIKRRILWATNEKNQPRVIKRVGSPTQKLSFCAFFHNFQKIFFKRIQKECAGHHWSTLLKTNRLQLISFLHSIFFSTLHGVSRLFAKTKVRKTRPKLEFLLLWTCKMLGSKQTLKWTYKSQKVELKTCKNYKWSKICLMKNYSSL